LLPVTFKDFWIGDQLTSLTTFLTQMQYSICIYPVVYNRTCIFIITNSI
jgi:hypothetical protein